MSDLSPASNEPAESMTSVERPPRGRWQIGLRTLSLLIMAIAVWMAYFINRRHNATLTARIEAMAPLAHELIVDDPKQIAVVKLDDLWISEDRWDIYLPDGRFRLCLATRGIGEDGLATVVERASIASGRHRLTLEPRRVKDVSRVVVGCDGTELLARQEPSEWDSNVSKSSRVNYSISEQLSPDEPVILLRRHFKRYNGNGARPAPGEPTDGILLWIERTAGPDAKH
ncbi:MAG: hypothetical protein ACLQGP_38630 [Isosphaeraceae bacterium]